MKKIHELPDWFPHGVDVESEEWLPGPTVVFERDGSYFFDGIIGGLIKQDRYPHGIEIILDMEKGVCLARTSLGNGLSLFMPFEYESFAFIWNTEPVAIHGIPSDHITLVLQAHDGRYPIYSSDGTLCNLFYRDGRFRIQPHEDAISELLGEAA